MITRINEVKVLVKQTSCDFKCEFSNATCNLIQKWNNDKCKCESKKYHAVKKVYSWNPITCVYENSIYLKSIADDSLIVGERI